MTETNSMDDGTQLELPADSARRKFCKVAIGGAAAVSAAAVVYPVVAFLKLPKSLGPVELMEVPLDELVEGYGYWGEHRGRQVVVIKFGGENGEFRAFDGACTHLGCMVRWNSADHMFECPCHEGKFDDLGNPVSGPVNAPLRRVNFDVDVEENLLRIRDHFGQT